MCFFYRMILSRSLSAVTKSISSKVPKCPSLKIEKLIAIARERRFQICCIGSQLINANDRSA